jgi:hypothetical protein
MAKRLTTLYRLPIWVMHRATKYDLNIHEGNVYYLLCEMYNDEAGYTACPRKWLAETLGATEAGVRYALDKLQSSELITKLNSRTTHGTYEV